MNRQSVNAIMLLPLLAGPRLVSALLVLLVMTSFAVGAQETAAGDGPTPPRLSLLDGSASFWRTGAEDWVPARVNTPLAAGDALYTGERTSLEIQMGTRAFVRAAEKTHLGFVNLEPDFLQIELKSGQAALDLRNLAPGCSVELDTPNAVFTIEHPGYYRAEVYGDETRFITRRAGRATISVEGGTPQMISPSEEIVVRGTVAPTVETYVASELDAWDRWNYARTDHEIEALSTRYVPPGVYGVGVLDHYGSWRVVPNYGAVWVPSGLPTGWAPYSSGSWVWDAYYGWTWIDDAPWGWAPFHYGRWVFLDGYWAWGPGPMIARPVYAPALVAFFGVAGEVSVRVGIGGPAVGWVALGWGEPLRPWWGRPGFIGVPSWGGWGGPRLVNNVVIDRHTVVNVDTIVYHNTRVPNALIAVGEKQFGIGRIRGRQFTPRAPRELEPIRETHPVRPGPASLAAATGKAVRPPPESASRSVLGTRPPRAVALPWKPEASAGKSPVAAPAPRVVAPPKQPGATAALPRPTFGEKGPERPRPAQPPRYEDMRGKPAPSPPPAVKPRPEPPRSAPPAQKPQRATPPAQKPPQVAAPPAARAPREALQAQETRALPGRPANAVSPKRAEGAAAAPRKSAPAREPR